MQNIRLSKNGWIMCCELLCQEILIGNAIEWLEEFITMGITHETIHLVLQRLESLDTSDKFDNIFGYADPSILLVPTQESEFDSVQRDRLERNFWNGKSRSRRRKLDNNL